MDAKSTKSCPFGAMIHSKLKHDQTRMDKTDHQTALTSAQQHGLGIRPTASSRRSMASAMRSSPPTD